MLHSCFTRVLVTLAICSTSSYARASSITNPHYMIGLNDTLISQYSGKNISVGVLDNGYFFDHMLVNKQLFKPVSFNLINLEGNKEIFDPSLYVTEWEISEDNEPRLIYTGHGAQVAGVIGAKKIEKLGYLGGIAPQAIIYAATAEPFQKIPDTPSEEQKNKAPEFIQGESKKDKYFRLQISTALSKLAFYKPFVINNSWNEDSTFDTAKEVDQKYKKILTSQENTLIQTIKDIVKQKTLMVFAASNDEKKQPGIMAALPRYFPELEAHYLSVAAVNTNKELEEYSNYCGISKNWCVTAPGTFVLLGTNGAEKHKKEDTLEQQSGTSYATPVITASLILLKERFPYFTASQIRDVLLTTSEDLGEKGIDEKYGWGLVNINNAIKGPKHLLRNETYNITQNDIWENNLITQYNLEKKGNAALTLMGENNLKSLNLKEGKLILTNKTIIETINNNSELAISDIIINSKYTSTNKSSLEILAPQAMKAKGENTLVQLAGSISVSAPLLTKLAKGDRISLLEVKEGANYFGGFSKLTQSDVLTKQGLRQDLYLTDKGIELKINTNKMLQDNKDTNKNGQAGLILLNQLRDSPFALQRGFYNSWLQNAIEKNQYNNLHYAVGNSIYADSLELLRHSTSSQLGRINKIGKAKLLTIGKTKIWLDNDGQRQKSTNPNSQDKLSITGSKLSLGSAHKFDNSFVTYAEISHNKDKLEKPFASAKIKQTLFTIGSRYIPSNWFVDISSSIGNISYKHSRFSNNATLGMLKTTGISLGLQTQLGALLQIKGWEIEPSTGLQVTRLSMKAANEKGELPVSTSKYKATDLNVVSRIKLQKTFKTESYEIIPNLILDYIHRLNNKNATQITSSIDKYTLSSQAISYHKNHLNTQVGALFIRDRWFIKAGITRSWFNKGKAVNVNMNLGINF